MSQILCLTIEDYLEFIGQVVVEAGGLEVCEGWILLTFWENLLLVFHKHLKLSTFIHFYCNFQEQLQKLIRLISSFFTTTEKNIDLPQTFYPRTRTRLTTTQPYSLNFCLLLKTIVNSKLKIVLCLL